MLPRRERPLAGRLRTGPLAGKKGSSLARGEIRKLRESTTFQLGAQTFDVLRLVVNQGMRPVIIGLAIGVAAAFALGRLISTQLYQVSAHNPALLAGATLLLAVTALVACLLPARRATLVDPVQALRTE